MGSLIWPFGMTVFPSLGGIHRPLNSRISDLAPLQIRVHNLDGTTLIHQHQPHVISSYSEHNHQSIVMGLDGSDFILVREAQSWLN